jgi:hypothetical protein
MGEPKSLEEAGELFLTPGNYVGDLVNLQRGTYSKSGDECFVFSFRMRNTPFGEENIVTRKESIPAKLDYLKKIIFDGKETSIKVGEPNGNPVWCEVIIHHNKDEGRDFNRIKNIRPIIEKAPQTKVEEGFEGNNHTWPYVVPSVNDLLELELSPKQINFLFAPENASKTTAYSWCNRKKEGLKLPCRYEGKNIMIKLREACEWFDRLE